MKLNHYRSAAEHCLGSVACHRHLPQKKSHGSFLQSFLLLAALLLAGVGVSWGQTELYSFTMPSEMTTTEADAKVNYGANARTCWRGIYYTLNDDSSIKELGTNYYDSTGKTHYRLKETNDSFDENKAHFKIDFPSDYIKAGDILIVELSPYWYFTEGTKTIGFKTKGGSESLTVDAFKSGYSLSHTITSADITNSTEEGRQYIMITMPNEATCYHKFTVTRPVSEGYTVTFSGINGGTVTATANGSSINSGDKVAGGTEVTFTATPTGDNLRWVWNLDGKTEYSWDPQTITVNKDVNVTHEFGSVYVNVYTNNASLGTVNIKHGDQNATTFHVTPWAGEFTLTASPTANGKFMGWYKDADHTQKIEDAEATYSIHNPEGTNNYFAYFVEGANTITKPGCGGYYMDQSKLNAGTATLSVSGGKGTVTAGASGGYVSVKFDQVYSFTNLKRYTVGGTNVAANLNNVEFLKNGVGIENANFYSGCSDKDLTVDNKNSVLTSVDEIRFHFKANTTTTIDYIYFEVDHGPRTKPTLANPTTAEMKIFSDETLQLRIANTAGFWREYTDDTYKTETTEHGVGVKSDGSADWKSSYDISDLPVGDYYFGIKDGGNCAENNKYHESGLVKVHVKVIEPIASIDVKGTKRYYDVYAPSGITSSESSKVGVVISLHGASNDYDNGRVDFDAIARNEVNTDKKFVVVYPRGLMRQLRGQERGWESYTESNTEDVDFFKAIVDELKKTYSVDMNRIYLAGFSNGGMMAYKAAHQAGDFFAAFASVGGYPVNESHLFHAGSQPTPFIHIQGADDTVFPSSDYDVNIIIHNMVYRNGAQFNPWSSGDGRVAQDGGMITLTEAQGTKDCHSAEAGGAAYYFYKINGMGHTWNYSWDGVDGDDVASTMWAFFNKAEKVNTLDKSLKFRVSADDFWTQAQNGTMGFYDVNSGTNVLTYGGHTKTNDNKNVWHSLQFKGGAHYMKLNMETNTTDTENSKFFMVTLTKTGSSTPIFSRRYQAGKGRKDLYINFVALEGFNEYKLNIIKSASDLTVNVHDVEFHSGYCEDVSKEENPTTFVGLNEVFSGMNPIYQPVYEKTYDAIAKEYLPIAQIPANDKVTISNALEVNKVAVTSLSSTITGSSTDTKRFVHIAQSTKDTEATKATKQNNACILGQYEINNTNGLNISAHGRAKMPEYLAGTEINFPNHGVIAVQVQGTLDLTFLAQNTNEANDNGRRTLKAYYTNDQLDGELKEMKEWWFHATRNEDNKNGYEPLVLNVRMQHLGQDGTCKIIISYEGKRHNGNANDLIHEDEDNDDVWIKGIIVKRPDLKVTIGRTDKLRYTGDKANHKNCELTPFGENNPYQWNFGTAGFANTKKSDLDKKKVNKYDGRTYICGVGPNGETLMDHVLVYSDGQSENDKANFDGRLSNGKHEGYEDDPTDNNEHIEFLHPTKYEEFKGNRRAFNPILSDGLKVNVTGSGWFTIACTAPNGPVKMKVLSSTNGGNAYMNVLREFDVKPRDNGKNQETDWQTFRVYLKAHHEQGYKNSDNQFTDDSQGFWDGNVYKQKYTKDNVEYEIDDPEENQMSLYVVFEATKPDSEYEEGHAQLNIHYLQWINEMPVDYVFQQEENPSLLNSLQEIVNDGTNEAPALYWQAGTTLTETGMSSTSKTKNHVKSAYDSADYQDREVGQRSGYGFISSSDDLACDWNVAAKANSLAHTEENYANHGKKYEEFNLQYDLDVAQNSDAAYSDKNHEFAIPVSGSFFRFMPMKNEFISTWIVPTEDDTESKIYVLDETGEPIPYLQNADMQDANKSKVTQVAREHGWVQNASDGLGKPDGENKIAVFTTQKVGGKTAAVRIDFAALAGKEYFIVADKCKLSLARLNVTGNAYRANTEELSSKLILEDRGSSNQKNITEVMNAGVGRHATTSNPIKLTGRTFAKDTWASLVLPFSMNEKKFEEMFGVGAKCLHFTKVETDNDNTIVFTHHFYNMIVAGRPVLIYPTKEVTPEKLVFTDVTLSAETVKNTNTNNDGFTFFASYDNSDINKNDLFINNKGSVSYWTGSSTPYPGMRSFVKNNCNWDFATGVTTVNQTKALFLNFDEIADEEISTSIEEFVRGEFGENAVVITKSTKAYDLNGRVVADGVDINNLPAGIYIVNGKKFIVK